ncbi:MAG: hypothetical protein ABH879_07885 [archaeon]
MAKGVGRMYRLVFMLSSIAGFLLLLLNIVTAPPVSPNNVEGRVFDSRGAGVENGIPVSVNNTVNGDYALTYVDAPSPPQHKGSYLTTITGSPGDAIIVNAWNSSHYGQNSTTLADKTTIAYLTINRRRQTETNVTILSPSNNTRYNLSDIFNVTARITIIGGTDGVGCNATISFSDDNILKAVGPSLVSMGNRTVGNASGVAWEVNATASGSTNITVLATCFNATSLDRISANTVRNTTVQDVIVPVVRLESPQNNTKLIKSNGLTVVFKYNVTDLSPLANCSLVLNDKVNQTNYTINAGVSQNFSVSMNTGNHTWKVNCTDNSTAHNAGASDHFNLTVEPNYSPAVSNVIIADTINLNPGDTSVVQCNATVSDQNGVSDIIEVNATLYDNATSGYPGDDDNNQHYSNNSCRTVAASAYYRNYSCSFGLQYYANSGTWECNITVLDNSSAKDSDEKSTTLLELLAINVSPSLIDYGQVSATSTSDEKDLTITNLGNLGFNVTAFGYGYAANDNLSMVCTKGNVSTGYQKYSLHQGYPYDGMQNLSRTAVQIQNVTLPKRTDDSVYGSDRNYTYWRLRLPSAVGGSCNGTIVLGAVVG